MRKYVKTTLIALVWFGTSWTVSLSLLADTPIEDFEIPPWTTVDFYDAIDRDDVKQIQEYLADSKRANKEFLSFYLLNYALELERDHIARLMVEAGAGENTLLAVQHENLQMLEEMLKRGVEPRGASVATERGDIHMVKLLLNHGEHDLNTEAVARNGQTETLKLLLDHGAEPEGLGTAILHGHEDVVELLLDSGADPNELDRYPLGIGDLEIPVEYWQEYLLPLHYAVLSQSVELVQMLLDSGADPNVAPPAITLYAVPSRFETWPTVLETASDPEWRDAAIVALLEKYGAKATISTEHENIELEKSLYEAAELGAKDEVHKILKKGAQPTVFGDFYYTFSSRKWNPEIVHAFIEAGVDPDDYRHGYAYTPAALALSNGDEKNFKRLMQAGANTDVFLVRYVYMKIACIEGLNDAIAYLWNLDSKEKGFAIWVAVNHGHVHTVEFLLARGSRPEHLRTAVEKGHTELVRMLLEAGADPNQKDNHDERSILELAQESESAEIIWMLETAGAVE